MDNEGKPTPEGAEGFSTQHVDNAFKTFGGIKPTEEKGTSQSEPTPGFTTKPVEDAFNNYGGVKPPEGFGIDQMQKPTETFFSDEEIDNLRKATAESFKEYRDKLDAAAEVINNPGFNEAAKAFLSEVYRKKAESKQDEEGQS